MRSIPLLADLPEKNSPFHSKPMDKSVISCYTMSIFKTKEYATGMTDPTLLILSDSHGRPDALAEAIRRVRPAGILFAGDGLRDLTRVDIPCPLWAVRGNCDWMSAPLVIGGHLCEPPEEELLLWEGLRILLCHGHRYGVKSGLSVAAAHAAARDCDILVFGHTHLPVEHRIPAGEVYGGVTLERPLYLFNPGSAGERHAPSFGTLTVRGGIPLFGHGAL